jgi:16S rRNA (guanine966-N2)-methyltransferase
MKLRIIAGELRHRFIQIPDSFHCRPTLERVRQSVAESIKHRIPDAVVVDLCAGSGAFGFEMVSRGAKQVFFVEQNRLLARAIEEHAAKFGVSQRCRVVCGDFRRFVAAAGRAYDIIFYDPPYNDEGFAASVPGCAALLTARGLCLFQREKASSSSDALLDTAAYTVATRTYGRTLIDFISRVSPDPNAAT